MNVKYRMKEQQGSSFIYIIPGLLLLLPAVYVILMLESTIEAENKATRNSIKETYQSHLVDASNKLSRYWQKVEKDKNINSVDPVDIVSATGADSVILYDKNGKMLFPVLPSKKGYIPKMAEKFLSAEELEEEKNYLLAINEYIYISENAPNDREKAIALYEAARLLIDIKRTGAALEKCNRLMFVSKFKQQLGKNNEHLALNAKVLFLKIEPEDTEKHKEVLEELVSKLIVYDDITLLTSQRHFLSKELREIHPELYFPLEEPERIALKLLNLSPNPDRRNILQKTPVSDLWQYTVNGRVVLLFTEENLEQIMLSLIGFANIPEKSQIVLQRPGPVGKDTIVTINAANRMPGWQISLKFIDPNHLSSLIEQRIKVYRTTATVVIIFSLTLGFLFIKDMRRRLRVADLKNDLVANVTHELKTPLASTRLLLDTLMNRKELPKKKLDDYLEHLSTENSRLCRLVEHFLAFSKLGKNQYVFQIQEASIDDLLEELNEALKGRFHGQLHRIKTNCTDDDVHFKADIPSLVTVLLNLIENALKFSEESRNVFLDISKKNKKLIFSVRDEGVGISRSNQRRVFNRFYQADERLSRDHGGCGLGLSIVKSVLTAHKSKIQVESNPGEGSRFYFEILITFTGDT